MPDNDPAAGIKDFERKLFTLDGFFSRGTKLTPRKSDPNKTPYIMKAQEDALDSFRKADSKKRAKKAVVKKAPRRPMSLAKSATKPSPRKRGL